MADSPALADTSGRADTGHIDITMYDAAQALPGWHAGSNLLHIPLTNLKDRSESLWHAIVLPSDRPTIVCLCGSTRFYDTFQRENLRLTLAGKIVLSIGCDTKSDGDLFNVDDVNALKTRLDDLHKRKIDLADEVLVLNVGGYIGDSTRGEIEYATKAGKPVSYLEASPSEVKQTAPDSPAMAPADETGHVDATCTNPDCVGCNFCDGGLWACTVCGGLEGSMPTKCPGRRMANAESDAVYAGHLDYRDNGWVQGVPSRFCPTGLFGKAGQ